MQLLMVYLNGYQKSQKSCTEYQKKPSSKLNIKEKNTLKDPRQMQLEFLTKVYRSLKDGGQLMLAIENKLSYTYLLGRPDPHVNLKFTTFLPRFVSNIISKIFRKRL